MDVSWSTYLVVVVLAYLIPGPDFLVIMRWSVRGRRLGVAAALGAQSGLLCHLALATAGLSVLLARFAPALTAVRIVGGLYLAFLGARIVVGTFRRRPSERADRGDATGGTVRRAYLQGLLTNVTNPKAVLFFAAVLSQFVDPDAAAPGWLQVGVLGVVDVAAGAVPWAIVVAIGAGLSGVLARDRVRAWWDRVTGTVLGGLGVGVLARG